MEIDVIYVKCPTCKATLRWIPNEYDSQQGHAWCMACLKSWTFKRPHPTAEDIAPSPAVSEQGEG